ncbi:hypothetical protein GCK72_020662 [Caenorhabditis remanei]|uniref:Seven TM Receptor n=1 Tax=Caenorhabditis remanei TaxID=31234 RepID=A0A6A5GFW6_CAERE|nr:hypothetical protein GCK72_020656 [Caenorhabditis remanei]XP_053582638.1 hypothetical protein GCK72_020662 [Caenorhabditis remanei]KAF1754098.1 hypothetical protein GCK72_020656 [Caenorhabditis remanei]KAF1754104.1 hypothetical protein GCK72_020662 [Caenorhabditis remanei]
MPDASESKSFTIYVKIAQLIAQFGFFSTTFFCYILIFLTVFGISRSFGSYKYLLILFPTVGIFFATIELILYPNVYSHNAGYVFYSTSRPFGMSQDTVTFCLCFYTGVYASTISMLSVQFLYRYWAIFDSDMLQKLNLDISEVSGVAVVAYDATGSIRWFNISSTTTMTCIMAIQYTVIIYCAIFMYIGMEEKLQMLSISLRNLHKQFFKTLILQIVTPTITLFSPVMLIIYLPLLDLECDLPTGIFLCAFTLYPAMDAIIVMYIVADYKKAAKKLIIQFLDKCKQLLSTVETEPSTNQTGSKNVNSPTVMN